MMDISTANQSHANSHSWAGHNAWSLSSPQTPPCNPLPGFQHLNLGLPPDQRPRHGNLQASSPDCHSHVTASSSKYEHRPGGAEQRLLPDAHVLSIGSSASRESDACSLPVWREQTQPRQTQNILPYIAEQAPTLQIQPQYTHQGSLNGPVHQDHQPISSPSFRQSVNHNPQCTSQPPFDRVNMESPAGYTQNHSLHASPIVQQPQETPPLHFTGTTNQFVPSSVAQDNNTTPQAPLSDSRYGLDPELLPSVVKVIAEDRAEWQNEVFIAETFSSLPPLATTSCIIEDRGTASPLAVRSTTYCLPCEGQTALLSHLPLGALVTPLAKQSAGQTLPVCSEQECLLGCGWCGASMCPAMGWQDCGQRFYCPFCGQLSEVPWQSYQPTEGVEGVRVDRDTRPELSKGSYEILGSHKGEAAALLLAIDVSSSALRGGHLEFTTQQILSLLTSLKRDDGDGLSEVRVGLLTYDSRIHLYDLSPALSRPHMLVITETDDLQLPLREGLLVPLTDFLNSIDSVLQLIPHFSSECNNSSGVPTELPVKAGLAILQAMSCPGKLLIFHSAPLMEEGQTKTSSGFLGSSNPKSIFQPSELAISLVKQCVSQGCSVHLFILSQQDVGGAWPGHIPYLTGGALHSYSHLQGDLDRGRFCTDLWRTVEMDVGYKAELKIFVSKDMRVSSSYGLFLPGPSPRQVAMASLDRFTTLAVELAHIRSLDETRGVAVQAVLSYSTQTGDRRTRVHSLTLRCSRRLQDTFRQYQAQTLLTFYCKKMYCAVLERPLQELRGELQTEVTQGLACYRKHCCSASVSTGQLVLPQHLRVFPVYINSLRKSEVLLPGLRSSVHERLQQRCQVLSMDVSETSTHFYPRLLPLPQSVDSTNSPNPEEDLRCCATSLEPTGLYLLHAPLTLLLWVGSQVPASTLAELFNTGCFFFLPSGETKLPLLENPLSVSVRSLITLLSSQTHCTRKLWVIKEGDACEETLQRHLVEDKSPNGGASYADFLYHLHVNSVRLLH
ncbi:protein transport protein Sec24C [Antennarius striatus]|uniref:protein transport protein Sec24C n=1 Tax=Antennarius striatus TaxID=241820 RepID=UPI0035B4A90F